MLLSFPREIGLRRSICPSLDRFSSYVDTVNGKANCYTSLFSFRERDPKRPWKPDYDSVVIDRAWWDFDMGERGGIDDVKRDVATLINRLEGDVRLVATGRGFHVHQLFKDPVIGGSWDRKLNRYERSKAHDLKTLDGVGFAKKMTRIPDTYNVSRGRWAVNIDARGFAESPMDFVIPTRPVDDYTHLDPFRGDDLSATFSITKWAIDNPETEQWVSSGTFSGEVGTHSTVPIPPCLDRAIQVSNPSHEIRVALVLHMAENLRWFAPASSVPADKMKSMEDEILTYIETLNWRDFNPSVSRGHIRTLLTYDRSPSAGWYAARGLCDGHDCWAHNLRRVN
tara:strand:- start:549 stop:1565 length:1017 start_codon:yes stop_codon:yes gene_type:complete